MSKEVIAVDLDDVVIDSAQAIIDDYNANHGTSIMLADFYSTDYSGVWNAPDKETAVNRVNQYLKSAEYFKSTPHQDTLDVIESLKSVYRMFVVTGRPDFMESATKDWLNIHMPDTFEDVIFTNYFNDRTARTKGDICHELGATMLIDDHVDHILTAIQKGIRGILFGNYPWNQTDHNLGLSVVRVNNWREVGALLLNSETDRQPI